MGAETTAGRRLRWSLGLNLAVAGMEIAGLCLSIRQNGAGLFRFYTEDSNLLAMASCAVLAGCELRRLRTGAPLPGWVRTLKFTAVCCLSVTFLVVVCILSPMMAAEGGYRVMLLRGSMLFHHLLCPLTALASLLLEGDPPFTKRDVRWALAPTALYAAVAVVLNLTGALTGPYPFLRVYEQPWYLSALWAAVILGGAFGIAEALRRLCGRVGRRSASR